MAKLKRVVVGSVYKASDEAKKKNPNAVPYIKMRESGKIYRLESPAYQLKSLEEAVSTGKLSGEVADTIKDRIEKIPPYVLFELVELVEKE